jgi:hypothetical protein
MHPDCAPPARRVTSRDGRATMVVKSAAGRAGGR